MRWKPTEWEKIFTNCTSDRGLIYKIHKEQKKEDVKKANKSIKRWDIDLNREFSTGISNDSDPLKEMFNILSHHQGDGNQRDTDILYPYCQNG